MGEVKAEDLAQYAASLAFRLGCRAGVGENIAIGEPFRAELERALTEAASLLRSRSEEIARLREAVAVSAEGGLTNARFNDWLTTNRSGEP